MSLPWVPGQVSRVWAPPELATSGVALNSDECRFFQDNGFLVKHALLDRTALDRALDRVWDHLLEVVPQDAASLPGLSRHKPATWVNPRWAPMPPHPDCGPYEGRAPVEYNGGAVKLHLLGHADYLLRAFARHPSVVEVAHALLGAPLRETRFMRGVYALFPTPSPSGDPIGSLRHRLRPHADEGCQQLNACAYLSGVEPRSGGFTVYPGSHRRLAREHRYEANWSPLPGFPEAAREVVESVEPLELVAAQGAVIFWHGRLLHSAGIHIGRNIRWAAFADFSHARATLTDDEHRAQGQFEWFKDVKLFRHDHEATPNLWRHWALGRG